MKTKIGSLVLSLFMMLMMKANAQNTSFTGGVTLGVSTTSVKVSDLNVALGDVIAGRNIFGVEGGFYGKLQFGSLYARPMVLVSYSTGQVDITDLDGNETTNDFSSGKIEVPVLVGLNIIGPLNIEAGPAWHWFFYEKFSDYDAIKLRTAGMGYRAGIMLDFDRVLIGGHYQGIWHNSNSSSVSTFRTPYELIFSVGIRLGDATPNTGND